MLSILISRGLSFYVSNANPTRHMAGDAIDLLAVDDDPTYLQLLETSLKSEIDSLTIKTAESAPTALKVLEQAPSIDCIISDYHLGDMDGLEFLRSVRLRDDDIPFILYTGEGSEDVASEAISAGVSDYVKKQRAGSFDLLANRIRKVVEKHRAEKELQEVRQRYELVGEVATDAFYDEDRVSGKVVRSKGYSTNFGYDPDDVGSDMEWWRDRVHPDDRDRVLNIEEQKLQSGEREFELTYRFRMADGTYAHVEERGIIVSEQNGTPERVIGTLTDITEKRQRERELQREVERLDEFAGLLSHDLQNSLQTIVGRLELINHDSDSEHIEKALQTASHMDRMINDILRYARQGAAIEERERIHIPDLLGDCWDRIDTKGASLRIQSELDVKGDRTRLARLFENLLTNAVEHGGEDVTIEVGKSEDGFYLEDDGDGFEEGELDDIFTVGYSSDDDGTGFGLGIVKEIAEAHGWSVDATQGRSGGARFEITGIDSI